MSRFMVHTLTYTHAHTHTYIYTFTNYSHTYAPTRTYITNPTFLPSLFPQQVCRLRQARCGLHAHEECGCHPGGAG
ncbi:hypothetical protein EON63_24160 [archaeon]|nr:MAG: hypothetical protein EON63_24160 [archaeon]